MNNLSWISHRGLGKELQDGSLEKESLFIYLDDKRYRNSYACQTALDWRPRIIVLIITDTMYLSIEFTSHVKIKSTILLLDRQ